MRVKSQELEAALHTIAKSWQIVGPVPGRPLNHWKEAFEDLQTISPKAYFLPAVEPLYDLSQLQPPDHTPRPILILGLTPCDLQAISLMDQVFAHDPYYQARRSKAVLVGRICPEPAWHCFCHQLGVDRQSPAGADLAIYPCEENWEVQALSPRGQQVWPDHLEIIQTKPVPMSHPRILEQNWEAMALGCLSCGICASVCPTCHCFDLVDRVRKGEGERLRVWDSCLRPEFTQMAGGENPRGRVGQRLQQRILHKLHYHVLQEGRPLCTGCGRCIRCCPVNIDIRQFIDQDQGVKR